MLLHTEVNFENTEKCAPNSIIPSNNKKEKNSVQSLREILRIYNEKKNYRSDLRLATLVYKHKGLLMKQHREFILKN